MITYILEDSIYLNITNQCTNKCIFCIRDTEDGIKKDFNLWLDKEPTLEEIIKDLKRHDLSKYKEVVFCGYGEPLIRVSDVIELCKEIKKESKTPIRINTNGHLELIYGKDYTPKFKGLVDSISISLNAKDEVQYNKICKPVGGLNAFSSIIEFAKKCRQHIPNVEVSVVNIIKKEDVLLCEEIARDIGVNLKVREIIR